MLNLFDNREWGLFLLWTVVLFFVASIFVYSQTFKGPFKGKSLAPSVIQPKSVVKLQGAVKGGIVMPKSFRQKTTSSFPSNKWNCYT